MPTLFIVDQSLEGIGGHCFDYARCLVDAAARRGMRTVVGAHRDFRAPAEFAASQVKPVFRRTSYSKFSFLAGLNGVTRQAVDALWQNRPPREGLTWRQRWRSKRTYQRFHRCRQRHIQQFAADCHQFFRQELFEENDHAIFAGVSELDWMGLAAYLSNNPRTLQVHWHLLFHFNVLDGRPADYAAQAPRLQTLARSFAAASARVPYHRLSFYATTEALVDQYNRVGAAKFRTLPYPINQALWESPTAELAAGGAPAAVPHPLVLTCAGAIRREKGQRQVLQTLVDSLGDELFASGRLALQVQRPRRRWGFRGKLELAIPAAVAANPDAIRQIDHPLPPDRYVELIQATDFGLLAYDSKAYFSRRAGILGEYLSLGRPVIVPSACWLSEQISVHTAAHIREQQQRWPHGPTAHLRDLTWTPDNVPQHGGIITFDRRHPFVATYPVPARVDAVVVAGRWHAATPPGAYCRLEVTLYDAEGRVAGQFVDVHDAKQLDDCVRSLVPLRAGTQTLTLHYTSACDERSLSLRDLQLTTLQTSGLELPRSAVGMIAADREQIPAAVREVVRHYPHYRHTAQGFSRSYREAHHPDRTLDAMLAAATGRAQPRAA